MKICENCGASNFDTASFCAECGTALDYEETKTVTDSAAIDMETETAGLDMETETAGLDMETETAGLDMETETAGLDIDTLTASIQRQAKKLQGNRKADVMFVLDCTGSMQGEIDAIRAAITAFADTIESEGVRARVGLLAFRDRLFGEEAQLMRFAGEPFTTDPAAFRSAITGLKARGGGDLPESSLDAVMMALRQPFDPDSNKVIVLVTDAPPHIPDKETQSLHEVIETIRRVGVQQFYLVIRTQDPDSQVYLKLLEASRGLAFELGEGDNFRNRAEDFKRTLMSLGKTISAATR